MPNHELTAAEKHEQARAFALSNKLSKFQLAKKRRRAEENQIAGGGGVVVHEEETTEEPTETKTSNKKNKPSQQSTKETEEEAATATTTTTTTTTATQCSTTTSSSTSAVIIQDAAQWPRVKEGEWQYVYIINGRFEGKFGYYDDQDGNSAIVYFGAPVIGEGPHSIPLEDLRKPPGHYCQNIFTAV